MADQEEKQDRFDDRFDGEEPEKPEAGVEEQVQEKASSEVAEATIITEDESGPGESADSEDVVEDSDRSDESLDEKETVESDHLPVTPWQPNKYQMAICGVLVAICVSFLSYGLGRLVIGRRETSQKLIFPEVYRAPADEGMADIITFARFVVPFPDEDDRTYLLLSISVKPSNRSVYKEIDERRIFCRGAIYAGLMKAVRTSNKEKVITGKELKQHILNALDGVLGNGSLDDIYFGEFLVV